MARRSLAQRRALGAAFVRSIQAALGEAALIRRIDRRADLALEDDPLFLCADFRHGNRRKERLRMVYPNRPSTAPDYFWTSLLKTPTIQVRWCDFDSDNHAPNEHLTLNNYLRGMQLTATVLNKIGSMR